MRRVTKRVIIFILSVIFMIVYCEFLIYYVVISQCNWPVINLPEDKGVLKALMLADIHLLGPKKGHWLDKCRREWQMHRAFQTIITLHKPEVVFILGDLFDEGEWSSEQQFYDYVDRFQELFAVPSNIKLYVVAGNHDIGFHNHMKHAGVAPQFSKSFNAPSVRLLILKEHSFVLLNSMTMQGDSCNFCNEARESIENISKTFKCLENLSACKENDVGTGKRPFIVQHFPLYRESDAICYNTNATPAPKPNKRSKHKKFREKYDVLSKEATNFLIDKLKPRAVFSGHTHDDCLISHSHSNPDPIEFNEYTVPSFSWRNRPNPMFMLATIAADTHEIEKCYLPTETAIVFSALFLLCVVILCTRKKIVKRWNLW